MQLLKVKARSIVHTMLDYEVTSRTYSVVTNAIATSCRTLTLKIP